MVQREIAQRSVEVAGNQSVAKRPAAERKMFGDQTWPIENIQMWPLDKIKRFDKNPRTHSREQIAYIKTLFLEFGWAGGPILLDDKRGEIIAGHGRLESAEQLLAEGHSKFAQAPVIIGKGWSDEQIMAFRIADNQSALLSGWNEELLTEQAIELKGYGMLPLLGFPETELIDLGVLSSGEAPGAAGGEERHALLRRIDITIDDPKHEVVRGDHYILAKRHHLICVNVITEWPVWQKLLTKETMLFCPYPGVFVPFSMKAKDHELVMVQPDPYICGHILDRFKEAYGAKSITKNG